MTEYAPSMLVGEAGHQQLATGFPIGTRFKSAPVMVCWRQPCALRPPPSSRRALTPLRIPGATAAAAGGDTAFEQWADWLATSRRRL
jgi:phenol 2-monooxygenase